MNSFSKMSIEVWTNYIYDTQPYDRMAIHADVANPAEGGLKSIWFVMSREELEGIVSGKTSAVEDGYHKLSIFGDCWTFYDFQIPTRRSGVIQVPYFQAEIPQIFAKMLLRVCKRVWKALHANRAEALANKLYMGYVDNIRVDVPIPQKLRDRTCKLYGIGRGNAVLDFGTRHIELKANWDKAKANGGNSFARCEETILNIARNSTGGFHQTASVAIYPDGNGFYWQAYNPRGRRIMNGGIVNHGTETEPDWSIHT